MHNKWNIESNSNEMNASDLGKIKFNDDTGLLTMLLVRNHTDKHRNVCYHP